MSITEDVDFLNNPNLTTEEKKAVRYYQDNGYQYIASYIYYGRTDLIRRLLESKYSADDVNKEIVKIGITINTLDQVFYHASLKRDYLAYRGISKKELKYLRKLKIGEFYVKDGFLSLTHCLRVALREDFAKIDENGELNIMTIELKKNSPGIFVGDTRDYFECEIVLPRERKLQLIGVNSKTIKELNMKIKDRIDILDSTKVNIFTMEKVDK